jgi:serine/threonine protein kinase
MEWLRGKCIGKGAFGTVHLAVDRATGRAFAVKSVHAMRAPAAALACLESEIRILRRLRSPYVVAYLGDGATATTRDLQMELLPGGTAAEAGSLGERAARGVLRRVVAALRYLHDDAGVVHGDVKGRNVLLGCCGADDGCGAKLADFGAARLLSDGDAALPHGPRGTPAWMAPEVARGGAATPESDVWSLGCTALELLTGKRPWGELGGASEVGELLFFIGFGGTCPAFPARLSDACRDFLDRCLRRDAAQRWTCEQLLRHPFLLSSGADAGEPSQFPSPRSVLDWAMTDPDGTDAETTESEHDEAMAHARGRVAELASDGPRASWEKLDWGTSATWVPLPISEAPRAVPSTSNSDAGNGAYADCPWPFALIASAAALRGHQVVDRGGGGLPCVHDRPSCHCRCCYYKYGFAVGWLPLAVVPGLMPCYCTVVSSSIRFNQVHCLINLVSRPISSIDLHS